MAEFLRAFADEVMARQRAASGARDRLALELAEIERRLASVLRAIGDGAWNDAVRTRLHDLEQRKAGVTAALNQSLTPTPTIALHPGGIELYRSKIAELERSLNAPEIRTEAMATLRSMIETVALTPEAEAADGLRAELRGDLATILSLAPPGSAGGAGDGDDRGRRRPERPLAGAYCRGLRGHATILICCYADSLAKISGRGLYPFPSTISPSSEAKVIRSNCVRCANAGV